MSDADRFGAPPQDVDAEQGTLGGMLLSAAVVPEVAEIVRSVDFYKPIHGLIFNTILGLHEVGKPADAITVAGVLADSGDLGRVGGAPYLHTLIAAVPTAANAAYYARIVADNAVLRNLDEACLKIRQQIQNRSTAPAELVETARTVIGALAEGVASTDGPTRWGDLIEDGMTRYEERAETKASAGISTGFADLDRVIKGFFGGRVYVVAGESGSGKSILVGDFTRSAAFTHGEGVLVFNMEMTKPELFDRLLCAQAGVHHDRALEGTLTDDDWSKLGRAIGITEDAPVWLDSTPNLPVADIRARAQRYKREHNIKIVVVDLIGLIEAHDRRMTREQQVADISRKLQRLSVELDVAVIVVAQINRNNQQRADKRPSIHDLRESAQIGHDAAVVMLVHRPEKHDRSKRPNEADIIIDKNRFGPETDVTVCSQLHYSRFASFAIPERNVA